MNKEDANSPADLQQQTDKQSTKKPYYAPKVRPHGGLAELVQFNPSVGHDGGTADCTLS